MKILERAADADVGLKFQTIRNLTTALTAGLSDADATVQSMADCSPTKWHLAHTTWFFETFVLRDFVPNYKPFNPKYAYLFNSYYEAEGDRIARPSRGVLTRPALEEIREYRAHVDAAIAKALPTLPTRARSLLELGCHHEQQHQELLLTDIQHLLSLNPVDQRVWDTRPEETSTSQSLRWIEGREGPIEIGHDGKGFAFDSEGPRHKVWLARHALAHRLVTNEEWRNFIADGGYRDARHWLSDGWAWVKSNNITAPLYWRGMNEPGHCIEEFGFGGWQPLALQAPVRHISFYEANAFAQWSGARLPTEAEWESAAEAFDPSDGTFLDEPGAISPKACRSSSGISQLFGEVWEWTGSAFSPFPGFRAAEGAVGEYNGKFMSGQYVLRGGSCATPRGHVRPTYRNFFYPHQRWQYTGLRLARDL